MLFNNNDVNSPDLEQNSLPAGERVYSIAVFGQTGEEIGKWIECTNLREEPGRVSFTDDRNHLVVLRGGITVIQEQ